MMATIPSETPAVVQEAPPMGCCHHMMKRHAERITTPMGGSHLEWQTSGAPHRNLTGQELPRASVAVPRLPRAAQVKTSSPAVLQVMAGSAQ